MTLRSGTRHGYAFLSNIYSIRNDMPACEKFETMSKSAPSGVMGWCFINTLIMTGAWSMGQGHRTGKSITTPGLCTSQSLLLLNYNRPDGMVRYLQTLV